MSSGNAGAGRKSIDDLIVTDNFVQAAHYLVGAKAALDEAIYLLMRQSEGAAKRALEAINDAQDVIRSLIKREDVVDCLKAWFWFADDHEVARWLSMQSFRNPHIVDPSLATTHLIGIATFWVRLAESLVNKAESLLEKRGLDVFSRVTAQYLTMYLELCSAGAVPVIERLRVVGERKCQEVVVTGSVLDALEEKASELGASARYYFSFDERGPEEVTEFFLKAKLPDRPSNLGWRCLAFAAEPMKVGVICGKEEGEDRVRLRWCEIVPEKGLG